MNDIHYKKKSDGTESALESRRQSVKRILGVGGLAAGGHLASGEWVKPIVNAVLLPAHAQTSPGGVDSLEDPCSITVVCTGTSDEVEITVTGAVEPPTPGIDVNLEIELAQFGGPFGSPEDFASVTTDGNGEYIATDTRSGAITDIRITATLPDFPEAGEATCTEEFDSSNPDHYGISYFCEFAGGF